MSAAPLHTVPTLAQSVLGRNTISSAQMRSYEAFLATDTGAFGEAVNALTLDEVASVARFGYSALGASGKALDDLYCAAWDAWVASLPVAPPKSHKWVKGVLAAALIISYNEG